MLHDVIGDRMILVAASALQCIVNGEENPFPAIGDAAYRKLAGGPSHGHRQHAQKIGNDRMCGSGDILSDRQTDRQTDRHTHHDTWQLLSPAK